MPVNNYVPDLTAQTETCCFFSFPDRLIEKRKASTGSHFIVVIKFRNACRKDMKSSPIRVSEFDFLFFSPDGLIFRAWSV